MSILSFVNAAYAVNLGSSLGVNHAFLALRKLQGLAEQNDQAPGRSKGAPALSPFNSPRPSQVTTVNHDIQHDAEMEMPLRSSKAMSTGQDNAIKRVAFRDASLPWAQDLMSPEDEEDFARSQQQEKDDASAKRNVTAPPLHSRGQFTTLAFDPDPKDGNPWYRSKPVSARGTAAHPHLAGITSSGRMQDDLLLAHNVVRRRIGISPLSWDIGLENLARRRLKKLTSSCYIEHVSTSQLWSQAGYEYIGENLYKVIGFDPTGLDISDAWYAEEPDYNYGSVGSSCTKKCYGRSSPPCMVGHFTQMLWSGSTHIGCMVSPCQFEADTHIGVCYYGPGGNIVGSKPFTESAARKLGFETSC